MVALAAPRSRLKRTEPEWTACWQLYSSPPCGGGGAAAGLINQLRRSRVRPVVDTATAAAAGSCGGGDATRGAGCCCCAGGADADVGAGAGAWGDGWSCCCRCRVAAGGVRGGSAPSCACGSAASNGRLSSANLRAAGPPSRSTRHTRAVISSLTEASEVKSVGCHATAVTSDSCPHSTMGGVPGLSASHTYTPRSDEPDAM